ncbi:MAG: hypothetical protein RL040_1135 [Bacteroidota bacterium]
MRKITLLILTLAYLSSVTEVHEFFKVANLFAHYMEHREQDRTLSFSDFLSLHYGNNSAHGNSSEHDDQLPFKSHHVSVAWFNLMAPIPSFTIKQEFTVCDEAFNPEAYYRCFAASEHESAIWQPPKWVV